MSPPTDEAEVGAGGFPDQRRNQGAVHRELQPRIHSKPVFLFGASGEGGLSFGSEETFPYSRGEGVIG